MKNLFKKPPAAVYGEYINFHGEATLLKQFLSPKKGSTLKGKNLLPGANSFLLELTHFQKVLDVQDTNRKSQTLSPLQILVENLQSILPYSTYAHKVHS